MDEVDLDIKNYDELFGAALDNTEQLFDNDEIDGLFETKDISVSNCQGAFAAEVILKMSHYLIYSVAYDHCNLIIKKSFFLLLLLFWIAAEKLLFTVIHVSWFYIMMIRSYEQNEDWNKKIK